MSISTQRCSATNRHGQPCQARAIERGLCAMHSGRTDPVAMGRGGGLKSPETQLRRELKDDEKIREQAKDVLRRGLRGDESISKSMLDAARSVVSWRAMAPPAEAPAQEHQHQGRGTFNLLDVFRTCCSRGIISQFARPEDQAEVAQLEARLAELLPRESISVEPPEPPEAA